MDIESLFGGEAKVEAETPIIEPAPVEEIQPVVEIAEDPALETPIEEPAPEPVAEPKEEKSVPLPTFLDIRDRLKETERERDELRRQTQSQPQRPNPYDDPEGFAAHQAQELQQALVAERFNTSDLIARQTHGADVVEAAGKWATDKVKADPTFSQQYLSQPHPMDWIVRQHKRDGLLSQIGEDPDEFVRRRAVELGLTAPVAATIPVAVQQQAPKPVAPRPSLASAPASGGGVKDVPTGPMAALEAVFKR